MAKINMNDSKLFELASKIMNSEEYYSLKDCDYFLFNSNNMLLNKEITKNTVRVNFCIDKKPKRSFHRYRVIKKSLFIL